MMRVQLSGSPPGALVSPRLFPDRYRFTSRAKEPAPPHESGSSPTHAASAVEARGGCQWGKVWGATPPSQPAAGQQGECLQWGGHPTAAARQHRASERASEPPEIRFQRRSSVRSAENANRLPQSGSDPAAAVAPRGTHQEFMLLRAGSGLGLGQRAHTPHTHFTAGLPRPSRRPCTASHAACAAIAWRRSHSSALIALPHH